MFICVYAAKIELSDILARAILGHRRRLLFLGYPELVAVTQLDTMILR